LGVDPEIGHVTALILKDGSFPECCWLPFNHLENLIRCPVFINKTGHYGGKPGAIPECRGCQVFWSKNL